MDISISPAEQSQCLDLNSPKLTFSLAEKTKVQLKDCATQTDFRIMEFLNDMEVSDLKKEVKSLNALNKKLDFKLDKANAIINNVKKIFTDGQIRKLILPDQNVKWSYDDISNAICLHAAGPKAYNHLYEKGFPLPQESALRRWHSKNDIVNNGLLAAPIDCVQHASELSDDDPLLLPDSANKEN